MGFIREFKDFAMRGNVMDLAIGVIIGGAFNKIVTAMVDSVIMPIIGALTPGGIDEFRKITLLGIHVGDLLQAILDFIIVAFVLFLIVKALNGMKKKAPADAPPPSATEVLLAEIRDELKKK